MVAIHPIPAPPQILYGEARTLSQEAQSVYAGRTVYVLRTDTKNDPEHLLEINGLFSVNLTFKTKTAIDDEKIGYLNIKANISSVAEFLNRWSITIIFLSIFFPGSLEMAITNKILTHPQHVQSLISAEIKKINSRFSARQLLTKQYDPTTQLFIAFQKQELKPTMEALTQTYPEHATGTDILDFVLKHMKEHLSIHLQKVYKDYHKKMEGYAEDLNHCLSRIFYEYCLAPYVHSYYGKETLTNLGEASRTYHKEIADTLLGRSPYAVLSPTSRVHKKKVRAKKADVKVPQQLELSVIQEVSREESEKSEKEVKEDPVEGL